MQKPLGVREPQNREMPRHIRPMLARNSTLPSNDAGFAFEFKWDGIRLLYYAANGSGHWETRTLRDVTSQYPELSSLATEVEADEAILDGEVIALGEDGLPSFELLQKRSGFAGPHATAETVPVTYMIFDLLYLNGESTMSLPYVERRRLLEGLELSGPSWSTPPYHLSDGEAVLGAAAAKGIEGVVAKKIASRYEPGMRSGAWLKIKLQRRQELVIGGWMPRRTGGGLGSLLVGYYDVPAGRAGRRGTAQRLLYAGSVGTGFSEAAARVLLAGLEPLRREASAFEGAAPRAGAIYVEPRLVAEVEFKEWTNAHIMRQPVFKGLRDDKDPRNVVREE